MVSLVNRAVSKQSTFTKSIIRKFQVRGPLLTKSIGTSHSLVFRSTHKYFPFEKFSPPAHRQTDRGFCTFGVGEILQTPFSL